MHVSSSILVPWRSWFLSADSCWGCLSEPLCRPLPSESVRTRSPQVWMPWLHVCACVFSDYIYYIIITNLIITKKNYHNFSSTPTPRSPLTNIPSRSFFPFFTLFPNEYWHHCFQQQRRSCYRKWCPMYIYIFLAIYALETVSSPYLQTPLFCDGGMSSLAGEL